jgi:cyclase
MLKIRIISILTFNGLSLIKTKGFSNPRMLGNPIQVAKVFNSRNIDELIFLDIMASSEKRKINLSVIKNIINECYMPVGIGGGINSLEDIRNLLNCGADKVIIKSEAIRNPKFISEASLFFGNQCISISIDAQKRGGEYFIFNEIEKELKLVDFVKSMELHGAGELIVTSVDNDGFMNGFDTELYNLVSAMTKLPIVAAGGGGTPEHYKELFEQTTIEAAGSSSIFAYTRYTPNDIKRALVESNKSVRYFDSI